MNRRIATVVALVCSALLAHATQARADRIKLLKGPAATGDIAQMTSTEVTIGGRVVPVNEIDEILYEGEPRDLISARSAFRRSNYPQALEFLGKIDLTQVSRQEIRDDVEFYRAMSAVRMALAGSGSKDAETKAGKQLLAFHSSHPNSFHALEASEALGDLLVSLDKIEAAQTYYDRLSKTPWPEYQMKAAVLIGRALDVKRQYPQAIAQFDRALVIPATGPRGEQQRLAATLGKAKALAGTGKVPEATKLIEDVIAKADPENAELHARAYNVLGTCLLAGDKKKDALLAFLHVDLLYSSVPDQHAEALSHLSELWSEEKKPERAMEARQTLRERYPNSAWARR